MAIKADRKVVDVNRKECFPTDHNFVSVTGSFYPQAQTLGGLGQFSAAKIYCTKCGQVRAL